MRLKADPIPPSTVSSSPAAAAPATSPAPTRPGSFRRASDMVKPTTPAPAAPPAPSTVQQPVQSAIELAREHYEKAKAKAPGHLIIFRFKDEVFDLQFEDAQIAAPILGLPIVCDETLPVPSVVFFASNMDACMASLNRAGHKFAVCDPWDSAPVPQPRDLTKDDELIAALDILAEYRAMGFVGVEETAADGGWVNCRSKVDATRRAWINKQSGYYADNQMATKGTASASTSLFDTAFKFFDFDSKAAVRTYFRARARGGFALPLPDERVIEKPQETPAAVAPLPNQASLPLDAAEVTASPPKAEAPLPFSRSGAAIDAQERLETLPEKSATTETQKTEFQQTYDFVADRYAQSGVQNVSGRVYARTIEHAIDQVRNYCSDFPGKWDVTFTARTDFTVSTPSPVPTTPAAPTVKEETDFVFPLHALSAPLENVHVDQIGLPPGTVDLLKKAGVLSVAKLIEYRDGPGLTEIPKIGKAKVGLIVQTLFRLAEGRADIETLRNRTDEEA